MVLLLIVCELLQVNGGLICAIKKLVHVIIIQFNHNHMTPMTSNYGGHVNKREDEKLEKKGFQTKPISLSPYIGAICTIHLKWSNHILSIRASRPIRH